MTLLRYRWIRMLLEVNDVLLINKKEDLLNKRMGLGSRVEVRKSMYFCPL